MKTYFTFIYLLMVINLYSIGNYNHEIYILAKNDSFIFSIKKTLSIDTSYNFTKLSKINDPKLSRLFTVKCTNQAECNELALKLSKLEFVEFVEISPINVLFISPNDINYSQQYALKKIQADLAWDFCKGNTSTVLAVVDDAVDINHQDLKNKIWKNNKEIPGNGIDDDLNGYIDDVYGWDAADNDNNPAPPGNANATYFSHGTHCAGIAAAETDNGIGIASIGFNLSIMPVKIAENNSGNLANAYQGVEYAILNGANVISMSWGGSSYSKTYQILFDYAYSKNIVCVAAAGNSGNQAMKYPAAYNHVIAVGSSDDQDRLSSFSTHGNWIDLLAPGENILSTVPQVNAYGSMSGTSMACPLTAGLCALMKSFYPQASVDDITRCLKSGCDNVDANNGNKIGLMGSGRINAYNSLKCLNKLKAGFLADVNTICKNGSINFMDKSIGNPTSWVWKFEGGLPSTSSNKNPTVTYPLEGHYDVQLVVGNGTEYDTFEIKDYIQVYLPSVRFSGKKTVLKGSSSYFTAHFRGEPPFTLVYTNGLKSDTIENITDTLYDIVLIVNESMKYWPVKIYDKNCQGNLLDTTYFNVSLNESCTKEKTFSLNIGSIRNDYIAGLHYKNNRFILGGYTDSTGNNNICIQELSINGLVQKGIIYSSNGDQKINKFINVHDGYILVGSNNFNGFGNDDVLVVKLNLNYNIIWAKTIGGQNLDVGLKVIESKNKKFYYISGYTQSYGQGNNDAYIIKLDSSGNFNWGRVIGNSFYGVASELIELESGNIIVSSGTYYQGKNTPFFIKLNTSGTILWIKEDANSQQSDGQALMYKNNTLYGTIRYKGTNNEKDGLVFSADSNLNIKWVKLFGTSTQDVPNNITFTKDSLIAISGFTYNSNEFGSTDNWVIKFSMNGTHVKNSFYGGLNDEIPTMINVKDNALMVSGYTNSMSFGLNDGYLRMFNCQNEECKSIYNKLEFRSISLNFININLPVTSGGNSRSLTLTPSPFKLRSKYICADTLVKPNCRLKADFTVAASCVGQPVSFYDNSIDSNGYPLRAHRWYFDFKDSILGVKNPHYTFKTAGEHFVSLVVYSGDSVLCSDLVTQSVWISDSMHVRTIDPPQICRNDSAQLKIDFISCGTAPYTYQWKPALGLSNPNIAEPKASPAQSSTYTLELTDRLGKKSIATTRVNIDPTCCKSYPSFSIADREICEQDSVVFINSSKINGNASYTWRFLPDGKPSSSNLENPPPVSFPSIGNKTIELVVRDACGNDTVIDYLGVNENPRAFAGNDSLLCPGQTVQLGEYPLGGYRYTWTPVLNLDNPQSSQPKATVSAAIKYILTVTDLYTACHNTDSVMLGLIKKPEIKGVNDTVMCAGYPLSLTYLKEVGMTYQWFDQTSTNPKIFNSPGNYWIKAGNSCTDSILFFQIKDSLCRCFVQIPNAFSPNDDGSNDVFSPNSGCTLENYEMMIFNRWGEIIFVSHAIEDGWDGKYMNQAVQDGIYYYIIKYQKNIANTKFAEFRNGSIQVLW